MKTIKKYSTGISGLDTLFHGGIQIEDFHNNDKTTNENGLLIALKASKGCNKTLFAMQLMQGLLGDFHDKNPNATFISLNKSKSDLSDMYYDVFISKLLNELCSMYVDDNNKALDINKLILKIFEKKQDFNEDKYYKLIECISNRVIYYNTRTNGLHYRRVQECEKKGYILGYYGDDTDNILYQRKEKLNLCELNEFWEEIIKKDPSTTYLRKTFNIKYEIGCENEHAIGCVQEIINKLYESTQSSNCFVIDGFSKLSTKELSELPYDELGKLLRKRNNVSILVFDERPEARIDADIVIDMRKTEATDEEYVYYELQISKSVFQTAALVLCNT